MNKFNLNNPKQFLFICLVSLGLIIGRAAWHQRSLNSALEKTPLPATMVTTLNDTATTTPETLPTPICPPYKTLAMNAPKPSICSFTIKEGLPPIELQVHVRKTQDWIYAYIQSMTVVQHEGQKIKTQLLKTHVDEVPPSELDTNYLQAEDVNFDGYKDLRLLTSWGATGNDSHDIWLYNPTSSMYIYSREASQLTSLSIDPLRQEVNSHSNSGASCWWNGTYKWQNGKLILVRYEYSDCDDAMHDTRISGELKNGKMIVTTTTMPLQQ